MSSAAITLNTPTGPLSSSTGVVGIFTRDADPDNAKVLYGANTSPIYGEGRARFSFPDCIPVGQNVSSGNWYITVPGYKSISGRDYIGNPEWGSYELEPSAIPFPEPPTRDEICKVQLSFAGLKVQTQEFDWLNWFEAALISLSQNDREAVYEAKHKAGDTHCIVSLSWNYDESPAYKYPVPGRDLTNDLDTYCDLII